MIDLAHALYIVCYLVGIITGLGIGFLLFILYFMHTFDNMLDETRSFFYKKDQKDKMDNSKQSQNPDSKPQT